MSAARRLVVTAPARANLIGNPSDLYGGAVLSCAVPCRARVLMRDAGRLEIATAGAARVIASRDDLRLQGDCFDVARAALAAQPELPQAHIAYDSEIPFGSGLAGSTALLAALLRALAAWRGEASSPYELAERSRQTERDLLGIACGWVDHYLCSFGGLRYVDLRAKDADETVPGEPFATVEDLAPYVAQLPFVLAFSGVSHHSGSVHAPIRARWLRGEPAVVRAYERIAAIAREGKTALLRAEWSRFAALMSENHAIQRSLGGSGDSNERLIAAALGAGALGAKLAGAGGGGTIVALWTHEDVAPLEAALRAAGATAFYRPEPVCGVRLEASA